MKHFNIIQSMLLLLLIGGVQTTKAQQDDINWQEHASTVEKVMETTDKYVYLYNLTEKGFLNTGGDYGMKAVLNTRGIRLTLESAQYNRTNCYAFKTPIVNSAQGSYLAARDGNKWIYIDRRPIIYDRWNREDENNDGGYMVFEKATDKTYHIRVINGGQRGNYLCSEEETGRDPGSLNDDTFTYKDVEASAENSNSADEWCLITLDDYRSVTTETSQLGDYNVSGLLYNTRFIRNVSDADHLFWKVTDNINYSTSDYCTAIAPEMGTEDGNDGYASKYSAFGCLEMGHVTGDFYQVVENLRPGLYVVSAQAFFHGNDSYPYNNGKYNNSNTTDESKAVLFANEKDVTIPMLEGDDLRTFENLVESHKDEVGQAASQYFRRNVPAAYFLANGDPYAPDESRCKVSVPVIVGEDKTLTLGVRKTGESGRVYMDNMTLTYLGNTIEDQFGFGVDAYGTKEDVDPNKYTNPGYMFYLSRKFTDNAWNALTLPVDLTPAQLQGTFGHNMKLVKLTGLNPQNPQQILFEPVDLDSGKGLEAGQCYLVQVANEPTHAANGEFKFKRIDESKNEEAYLEENVENVTYKYGNVYQFLNVTCPNGISKKPVEGTTPKGELKWTACYYASDYAPKGSYIMSSGNMYHLSSDWYNLIGTTWYLTETNPTQGTKTFVIDNGSGTTDINGIVTETPAEKAAEGVYTINGQKIASDKSLNDLPKGIYIVNGKKHIVR